MQFLRNFDIFGQSTSLTFRKEQLYRTVFGGFMSLLIVAFVVSFFYANIISFFSLEKISAKNQLFFNKDPGRVVLSKDKYMIAVQIDQPDFLTNPYFNVTLEQRHYYRRNGTFYKGPGQLIDLVPCTLEHYQPIFEKYGKNISEEFYLQALNASLCPSLKSQDLIIQGLYQSQDFYHIKVSIFSCQNNTGTNFSWQPVCKSNEQMNSYLNANGFFRLRILTLNYLFNPEQSKGDIIPYIDSELFFNFVPGQMFSQADIYYRQRNVSTDSGILMIPNVVSEIFPARDPNDFRQQTQINNSTNGYYGAFYPQQGPYEYLITRQYLRLDELLSYMGGFLQFTIVIIGILVKFYNKQHMVVEMANDLFGFCIDTQKNPPKKARRHFLWNQVHNFDKMRQQYRTFQSQRSPSKKVQDQDQVNQDEIQQTPTLYNYSLTVDPVKAAIFQKIKSVKSKCLQQFEKFKEIIQVQNQYTLTFKFILGSFIGKRDFFDDKTKLLLKASKQIQNELDIEYILKQLYEIEKIKQILLVKDQIELFNFSQKPIIYLRKNKRDKKLIRIQPKKSEKEKKITKYQKQYCHLINSYKRIQCMNVKNLSEEQQRMNIGLIKLLGNQIPQLIEEELLDYKIDDDQQQPTNKQNDGGQEDQNGQEEEKLELRIDDEQNAQGVYKILNIQAIKKLKELEVTKQEHQHNITFQE
ncbi:hypothetical protein pb186bvf_016844 [Paramecium bursaria]